MHCVYYAYSITHIILHQMSYINHNIISRQPFASVAASGDARAQRLVRWVDSAILTGHLGDNYNMS